MLEISNVKKMSDSANNQSIDSKDEDYVEGLVRKHLEELGDNPSLIDAVSVILKQSAKAECEARKVTQKLEYDMAETLKIARDNQAEIGTLKNKVELSDQAVAGIQERHHSLEARLNQMEFYVIKLSTLPVRIANDQAKAT